MVVIILHAPLTALDQIIPAKGFVTVVCERCPAPRCPLHTLTYIVTQYSWQAKRAPHVSFFPVP